MLLQAGTNGLPIPHSFSELVENYGPYLGLVLGLIIAFLIMQYIWFKKVIKAKDGEIDRLVKREDELNRRLLHMIDIKLNYKDKAGKK